MMKIRHPTSKSILSEEDKALFRQSVDNLPCLGAQPNRTARKSAPFFLSDSFQTQLNSGDSLFYCRNPLEKNHLQQFKRGQLSIEAKLDLHGYTRDEASAILIPFIQDQYDQQHRVLLIVHGKGQPGGVAPLKNLVNHWLPQFPEVLAFSTAQPNDGGTGAVYVLLKRACVP